MAAKQHSKNGIIEYYNRVFQNFQKDPSAAEKLEYRRKYCSLTEEDLLKPFTI